MPGYKDPPKEYKWKKGQSGNILGRPKSKTLKEWARDYLSRLNDEERDDFFEGIDKSEIWRMAEGNPKSDMELSGEVKSKIIRLNE